MKSSTVVLVLPLLVLTGCPRETEPLSVAEARQALEQASSAALAEGLTSATVELGASFTFGQSLEQAAEELRAFVAAQLPCAEVSAAEASVQVVYGAKSGACSYRGHELSGTHELSVERDDDVVQVHHRYTGLSNGVVSLDGTADVTWNTAEKTRRVRHESSWTHLASGRTGVGSGDRVQAPLPGDPAQGISIDGSRSWQGERGSWDLAIEGVELRFTDPVPQAGSYTLVTPFGKSVSMSFRRVDGDTIGVTVACPRRELSFTVSKRGAIAEEP